MLGNGHSAYYNYHYNYSCYRQRCCGHIHYLKNDLKYALRCNGDPMVFNTTVYIRTMVLGMAIAYYYHGTRARTRVRTNIITLSQKQLEIQALRCNVLENQVLPYNHDTRTYDSAHKSGIVSADQHHILD
jgi:hypothetical protein